jgi:type IV pilus assembly protein PilO
MTLRDPKLLRILLTVVVGAVGLWGYFLSDLLPFGYQRRAKQLKELKATHETVSAELEKARRSVHNLPQLEAEQRELERKWKQAEALLPTDKEVANLLTQVTEAGEQAGVAFETFKPGGQRPQEFYNENPVEIQVRGGFHQVGVFLARIANLPRIVNVGELKLEGGDPRQGKVKGKKREAGGAGRTDHTLTANFTATAYSLRDAMAEPPPAVEAESPVKGRRGANGRSTPKLGVTKKAKEHAAKPRKSDPTEGEQ